MSGQDSHLTNIEHGETALLAKLRDAFEDAGLYEPDPDMVECVYLEAVEPLARQLRGAVQRGDWFRQAWANYAHCSVEDAELAYETLGDITAKRGESS